MTNNVNNPFLIHHLRFEVKIYMNAWGIVYVDSFHPSKIFAVLQCEFFKYKYSMLCLN